MAQLVEMTSVLAAEHRIKKPIKVPRPNAKKKGGGRSPAARVTSVRDAPGAAANPYAAAIAALGGTQPSAKRELLAGQAANTEGAPAPRGDYGGAIARLTASQPKSKTGGDTA